MGLLEGDRFYILINGAPVTKPGVDGLLGGDQTVQASTNSSPEGAVFSFNPVERHLYSDGYFLGRNLLEDRSLLPKKIVWSRDPSYLLPVHTDENNPQKLRFSGEFQPE